VFVGVQYCVVGVICILLCVCWCVVSGWGSSTLDSMVVAVWYRVGCNCIFCVVVGVWYHVG